MRVAVQRRQLGVFVRVRLEPMMVQMIVTGVMLVIVVMLMRMRVRVIVVMHGAVGCTDRRAG